MASKTSMGNVRLLKIKAVASYLIYFILFFYISFAKSANGVLLAVSGAVSFSADRRKLGALGHFWTGY